MDKQEMSNRGSADTMTKLGIEKVSPLRTIRMKCNECMGGQPGRLPQGRTTDWIDECSSTCCPLWPFRYGRDPWRAPMSEAQKKARMENLEKAKNPLVAA